VLESERERLDESDHHLAEAVRLSDQLGLYDDAGAAEMAAAWNAIRRGHVSQAARSLHAAETFFGRAGTESWRALASAGRSLAEAIDTQRAWVFESELKVVEEEGGRHERDVLSAIARLAEAVGAATLSDEEAARELDTTSLHVRAALAAATELSTRDSSVSAPVTPHPRPTTGAPVLYVEAGALSFRVGDEPPVDLRRRRSIRLLLAELARLRVREPGEVLDVYEAFEVGWPGEKAMVEAAADRVYWAVATLRRLGLKEILMTTDEGYHLAPDYDVIYDEETPSTD
jgi:hypothetical protein